MITASQIPTVLDVPAGHPNPFLAAFEALRQPAEWRPASNTGAVVLLLLPFTSAPRTPPHRCPRRQHHHGCAQSHGRPALPLTPPLFPPTAPLLEERLGAMLGETPAAEQLVIHLGGLGRIDVSGALGLRSALEAAQQAGLGTAVCDVPPQATKIVQRVLEGRHGS